MGDNTSCCQAAIQQQQKQQQVSDNKLDFFQGMIQKSNNYQPLYKYRQGQPSPKIGIKISKLRQYAKTNKDWQYLQDNLFDLIGHQKKKKRKKIDVNRVQMVANKLQDPYFIPNQNAFYLGQWAYDQKIQDNVPFGIGKLYQKNVISQGVFSTYIIPQSEKSQEQMKPQIQQSHNFRQDNDQQVNSQFVQNKIDMLINGIMQKQQQDGEVHNIVVKLNGQGIIYSKQLQMHGTFTQGILNGKATLKMFKQQYQYEGTWKNGHKHGKGKQTTKQTSYQGYFKDDLRDGRGIQQFYGNMKRIHARQKDERKFEKLLSEEGQQIKLQMQKKLKTRKKQQKKIKKSLKKFPYPLDFNTKSIIFDLNVALQRQHKNLFLQSYNGQFSKNLMHGKGKYTWMNKKIYDGNWKQGKMDGQGQFYWPDGSLYQGNYMNDLRHGKGLMIWTVYQRYRGDWAFGLRHGYGQAIQISKDWKLQIKGGIWKQDKLIQQKFRRTIQVQPIQVQK